MTGAATDTADAAALEIDQFGGVDEEHVFGVYGPEDEDARGGTVQGGSSSFAAPTPEEIECSVAPSPPDEEIECYVAPSPPDGLGPQWTEVPTNQRRHQRLSNQRVSTISGDNISKDLLNAFRARRASETRPGQST